MVVELAPLSCPRVVFFNTSRGFLEVHYNTVYNFEPFVAAGALALLALSCFLIWQNHKLRHGLHTEKVLRTLRDASD